MSATPTIAKNNAKVQLQPTPTAGERFSDGTVLELILDPRASSTPQLLRWRNGQSTVALEHEYGGRWYDPCQSAAEIRHLPSKQLSYKSTEKLFNAVREFILKALGPSAEDVSYLLAFFAFASFFCECLNMAPCLLLWTPAVLDGIAVLRTLACVCFHPLLLATGTPTSWAPELQPITRLVCQPDSELDILLAGLQFQGFGVAGKGLRHISGATAVLVGDAELKTPFADSCYFISLPPLMRTFSTDDEEREKEVIEGLQNRLLSYRLKNFGGPTGAVRCS